MKRAPFLLLALAIGLQPTLAGAENWYAARVTSGDTPFRVEHFWSKGAKVRMETVVRGQPFVTFVNGEYYTVIDPVQKNGTAVRRHPSALKLDRADRRPFARDADRLIEAGAEKVGTEVIAGRSCDHFRATNRLASSEAWVTTDEHKLPLRIVRYDRSDGSTRREEFVDWARPGALPDSFFQASAGYQIERVEYEEYAQRMRRTNETLMPILLPDLLHGRE